MNRCILITALVALNFALVNSSFIAQANADEIQDLENKLKYLKEKKIIEGKMAPFPLIHL